jgi:hypothetical protein
VLSIERLGDAKATAGDPTAAARFFAEGLAVVEAAPDGCFDPAAGGAEGDAGERLEQAAERLQQKADQAAGSAAPQPAKEPGQDDQPADPGQQSQLDALKESSREAQGERNTGRERDEYLRDEDFTAGTGRPW